MADISEFLPEWTSPPGHTIADILSARQLSRGDFAHLLEESVQFVNGLIEGRETITLGVARRLHEVIGGSAAFWMTRDRQYRDDVARQRETGLTWLRELPLDDMRRLGWISAHPPQGFEAELLLQYFAVPSVSVWRTQFAFLLEEAAFRTSPTFESSPGAVAAWLRQGELIAGNIACAPWDPHAAQRALVELRPLTRVRDPRRFIPKLQATAASCGIAVVLLQAPSGCRASGAVRWLSRDKALVLLSARHLTDDHLWFTFYHECAHLLLHDNANLVLDETVDATTAMENEANSLASELLIPPSILESLARVGLESRAILRLAAAARIAPGILVAQLQRMKRLSHRSLNSLKRRYEWVNGELVSRGSV